MLTGAGGFVGAALLSRLASSASGYTVRAGVRRADVRLPVDTEVVRAELAPLTDWSAAVRGVDVVVHAAARVHVMSDRSADPSAEFRRVNVEGTLNLAGQAATAGVRRFVFISSIKVNGESTLPGKPFTAGDVPAPVDPYGLSKYEAEESLRKLAAETGMELVIVRPPLVYGPGVKANFLGMMRWLYKGVPLPLGAVHNRRSLVALDNLVDLIVTCMDHPAAAGRTFLVSDGDDLSTTELLRRTGEALGRPARLLPVPVKLLEMGAACLGRRAVARRLCGSLQVDITETRERLGWEPPVSVDEALQATADDFLEPRRRR